MTKRPNLRSTVESKESTFSVARWVFAVASAILTAAVSLLTPEFALADNSSVVTRPRSSVKQLSVVPVAGVAVFDATYLDKSYAYGGLGLYHRVSRWVGWHLEAGGGPEDAYRLVAGGAEAYLWEGFRAGVGLGVSLPLDHLGGNPIIVPLPEATVGYHRSFGGLTPLAQATINPLYSNARFSAGVGYTF